MARPVTTSYAPAAGFGPNDRIEITTHDSVVVLHAEWCDTHDTRRRMCLIGTPGTIADALYGPYELERRAREDGGFRPICPWADGDLTSQEVIDRSLAPVETFWSVCD